MSFATATPAQRRKVRDEATKAMFAAQPFAQNAVTPTAAESTAVGTVLAGLSTALADVGVTAALPATQAVVSDGGNVTVKNSAGTVSKTGVATVAANAITGVALASTEAILSNGGTAVIQNSGGQFQRSGTAAVAAGVVTNLTLPADVACVVNAGAVVVRNSAATAITGTHTAAVAAGVLSQVTLASTVAPVISGVKINATSVTGTGNFATITVTNGVITAIVLSAS